jgi:hypothetical protein
MILIIDSPIAPGEVQMSKNKNSLMLLVFLLALLPFGTIAADTGPKPTMDFEFSQEVPGAPLTIVSGVMYECEQADCSDAAPLQEAGPQRFTCEATSCHALAYGFSPYHQLEIQFSDGQVRRSNIFETGQFVSTYQVAIRADDLLVESKFSPNIYSLAPFALLCCFCLFGLTVVAVVFLVVRRAAKKQ